jgi:hypothetical protein
MLKGMTTGWHTAVVVGALAAVAALAPAAALAQETAASGADVEVGGVDSSAAFPGGLPNTGGGPAGQGTTIGRPITLPNTGQGSGSTDALPALFAAAAGLVIVGGGAYARRGRARHSSPER